MNTKNASFLTLLFVFFFKAFCQISEEEFKKSFKRPDEALLSRIKQAVTIPVLTEDFAKFYADRITYTVEEEKVIAEGGGTMIYKDTVLQADRLVYDKKTGDVEIIGNVRLFRGPSMLEAKKLKYNIKSGTGSFDDGKAFFIDSFFSINSKTGTFQQTSRFNLKETNFSSCRCQDLSQPWVFSAKECRVVKNQNISAKHVLFKLYDVPVLYIPYLWLPLEETRKSGFLTPKLGYSERHGAFAELPYFIPPSVNSELTLTPFYYQKTRYGVKGKWEYLLLNSGFFKGAFYYSNEGPRKVGGKFENRGLNPELFRRAKIDTNRFGGAVKIYKQIVEEPKDLQLDFFADAKRASDDLLIKETKNDIARYSAPFLVSFANLRARSKNFGSLIIGAESVQDFGRFQDRIFDEAPSVFHSYSRSLPMVNLGVTSLASSIRLNSGFTNYIRTEGYEGTRLSVSPLLRVKAPLWYLGEVSVTSSLAHKVYNTQKTTQSFEDSVTTTRTDMEFSTKLERLYKFDKETVSAEPALMVKKYKHWVSPFFGFISQENSKNLDNVPNFDPVIDKQRDIRALRYGFRTAFNELTKSEKFVDFNFPEIIPDIYDYIGEYGRLTTIGREEIFAREYSHKNLLNFEVSELYSLEDEFEATGSRYSNTSVKGSFNPIDNVSFRFRGGIDRDDTSLNFARLGSKSTFMATSIYLDYVYKKIKEASDTNEVITGIKFDLTDRVRLGSWLRFDLEESQLYDTFSVVQFSGSCRCWYVDLGLERQKNPDDLKLSLTVVLAGIGDVAQDLPIFYSAQEEEE